jgi:hypothetical protein
VSSHHHLVSQRAHRAFSRLSQGYDLDMQRLYIGSTRALSMLLVVLGLTLIVSALVRGGGALALGVVVGVGLTLGGVARLWLMRGIRDEPQ